MAPPSKRAHRWVTTRGVLIVGYSMLAKGRESLLILIKAKANGLVFFTLTPASGPESSGSGRYPGQQHEARIAASNFPRDDANHLSLDVARKPAECALDRLGGKREDRKGPASHVVA